MKETPLVSSERSHRAGFPLVDHHYQTPLDPALAGAKAIRAREPVRAIWKLSAEFFGAEAAREYAIELSSFCVIAALSAYSIFWNVVAAFRMLRGY